MCGIAGFYSRSQFKFDDAIIKMNKAINHRGPDSGSSWFSMNSGIVLGHQRLSILDLSDAGSQPMQSNSGRFILTYNGEIYNHLEIRSELEINNSKVKWRGNSDTETLIEAIDFWGIETSLKKIEGMFAFGIWDQKEQSLTLARDRIGEKPLYYGWQGDSDNKVFIFGSELKALKVHPQFKGFINRDVITLLLRHNYIPAPYSIYKNIFKLTPGHYLKLNKSNLDKNELPISKKYWSLAETAINGNINQLKQNEEEIQQDLEKLLKLSVKKQMISDVPLGAFLSGGIDSTTIVALMHSISNSPVKTFTIGFNENEYSEAEYAKKISKHLGTDHTELYVTSKDALNVIPKLPIIYDEPFSDSSQIPTFLVSQLTKQHVKVALSGDGGDELFCGYNRYVMTSKFWKIFRLMPLHVRKILASGFKSISVDNWNMISRNLPILNKYPNFGHKIHKGAKVLEVEGINKLYQILSSHWLNPSELVIDSKEPRTLLNKFMPGLEELGNQQQMMVLDFLTYLPNDILVKVDRAAMSSSLETRIPFLNHNLIEYVWKIPHSLKFRNGQGKWILRQILNKYVPKNLTDRPKMGFGVPIDIWLRGPLRDWAENLLGEKKLDDEGYFNSKLIREKWQEHLSGKRNWQSELWNVLMFQAWIMANK